MNYIVEEFGRRDWDTKLSYVGFLRAITMSETRMSDWHWHWGFQLKEAKYKQQMYLFFNQPRSSCCSYNLAVKEAFPLSSYTSTIRGTLIHGLEGGWCFYEWMNSALELLSHVCLSFRETVHSDKCCPIMRPLRAESTSLRQKHAECRFNQRCSPTSEKNQMVCCLLFDKIPFILFVVQFISITYVNVLLYLYKI